MTEFKIGGPDCYGKELKTPKDAQDWLDTTPVGSDPTMFMSPEEITAFYALIPHIAGQPTVDRQCYLDLGRTTGLQTADEIAGYESI